MNNTLFEDFFEEENFLKEDIFRNGIDDNQEIMFKLFERMDAIKNTFLIDTYLLIENK